MLPCRTRLLITAIGRMLAGISCAGKRGPNIVIIPGNDER